MKRVASSLALLGLVLTLGSGSAVAQEEAPNPFVRESYWKISFADMEAWNSAYMEYVVPILTQMQTDGVITGFTAGMHHTGGDYNWRMALICPDWASIDAAVDRLTSELSTSGAPNMGEMMMAHADNIWELTDLQQREDAPANAYVYIASFHVKASEMEGWNSFYADIWAPALQGAMDAGHLNGWAVEEHAHGGNMNWQILYLLPSWDAADDAWNAAFAAFEAHPERYARLMRAFVAHEDNIFETLTVETGDN